MQLNHPLFTHITDDYSNLFVLKTYDKKTLLFNEGEACLDLALIIEGQVTISTQTYFDHEYIINVLNYGGLFGEFLLFNPSPTYLGDIIAQPKTTIAYIRKDKLLSLLTNKDVLENYLSLISRISLSNQNKLKILTQKNLSDRIMFYLIDRSKKENKKTLKISSKEELANILNIPRPSLSRTLITLKESGLIDYDRYTIILK